MNKPPQERSAETPTGLWWTIGVFAVATFGLSVYLGRRDAPTTPPPATPPPTG
jgi:hypothetical protein